MRTVYLAGPIAGCTKDEANDWRTKMIKELDLVGIQGVSPLRCEPLIGDKYDDAVDFNKNSANHDPRFKTADAISNKNLFDVINCDFTLAYLPKELNDLRPSYGTACEIAWAGILKKPIIIVTDDEYVRGHPVLTKDVGWLLDNFDDALDVLTGILGVYT